MTGCGYPVRECLSSHISLNLAEVRPRPDWLSIRARCPACGNSRSLEISAGRLRHLVWHCHAGCDQMIVRKALIKAGVTAACLLGNGLEDDPLEVLRRITGASNAGNRSLTIMRVQAFIDGITRWPRGSELVDLAASCGVSRREAFRIVGSGASPDPGTSSTYRVEHQTRNQPQVSAAFRLNTPVPSAPFGTVEHPVEHPVEHLESATVAPLNTQLNTSNPSRRPLAETVRAQVLELHDLGRSYRDIARQVGVSVGSVHHIVRAAR